MKKILFILSICFFSLLSASNITSDKDLYTSQERISLQVSNMPGNQDDWVAIYPENASTDWKNVLQWTWTKGAINQTFTFDALPKGNYEARTFFKNSYIIDASYKFKVDNQNPLPSPTLNSQKISYNVHENIFIDAQNMSGAKKDWIAIYEVGASNEWGNVLRWTWTEGKINNTFRLRGLPEGEYEARAFFNNSYTVEAVTTFSVKDNNHFPTIIETRKAVYNSNERIQVLVDHMLGDNKDWVAIFPKNSSNEWKNVLQWTWTGGYKSTIMGFQPLTAGEYEVRAFFKNSYKVEAKAYFTVIVNNDDIVNYVKDICTNHKTEKNVVCLEEFNLAYFRKKDTDINEEVLYAINTQDNWSIIKKTYLDYFSSPQISKLANTPLLLVRTSKPHSFSYNFYYTDTKNQTITKLLEYYKYHDWTLDKIETLENGTKLSIKAHHDGSGEVYYKIYDINNLPSINLIN